MQNCSKTNDFAGFPESIHEMDTPALALVRDALNINRDKGNTDPDPDVLGRLFHFLSRSGVQIHHVEIVDQIGIQIDATNFSFLFDQKGNDCLISHVQPGISYTINPIYTCQSTRLN